MKTIADILNEQRERLAKYFSCTAEERLRQCEAQLFDYVHAFLQSLEECRALKDKLADAEKERLKLLNASETILESNSYLECNNNALQSDLEKAHKEIARLNKLLADGDELMRTVVDDGVKRRDIMRKALEEITLAVSKRIYWDGEALISYVEAVAKKAVREATFAIVT